MATTSLPGKGRPPESRRTIPAPAIPTDAAYPDPNDGLDRRPLVWTFDRDAGWSRTTDPVPPSEDFDRWLERTGFTEQLDYAGGMSALSLAIYSDDQEN